MRAGNVSDVEIGPRPCMAVCAIVERAKHHERIGGRQQQSRSGRNLGAVVAGTEYPTMRCRRRCWTAASHSGKIRVRRMEDTGVSVVAGKTRI